ncbi:MAG TPA: hypothetical protein VFN74_10245 [Chloroflexota bacterium]|nr:hypothetical protein [Chloroflexota bacterium]
MTAPMADRFELSGAGVTAEAPWTHELARRLVTGLLGLAFLAAVLVSLVTTEPRAGTEPVPAAQTLLSQTEALQVALDEALAAVALVDAARDGASVTEPLAADRAVDDAWLTLAVVYDRLAAQLEAAAGVRPPLMAGRPPAPIRASREDGLVRSALSYVRGGIEARDARALERARDLLRLAREAVSSP